MMRYRLFFGVLLFFLSAAPLQALQLPPAPNRYVSDFAGLLTEPQRHTLEQMLAQFERETSNQILVVTVPDLQGETVEEFSMRLAERWKPGHQGRDNGVILLVAPRERKVRIEVGYGLEGALTDALSKSILEDEILPVFKRGDFYGGIQQGVLALAAATRGEYSPMPAKSGRSGSSLPVGFFLAVIFFIVWYRVFRRGRGYGLGRNGWYVAPFFLGGSSHGGGGGGGGSSGFSGGGGSFGGGGSSGSW
jgi:uncharacterized protein